MSAGEDTLDEGADPARLEALAADFLAQARGLRRRARWNISWIVAVVVLMTVLVVALPPLVQVAEDEILGYFNKDGSQYDLQEETRLQAARVSGTSQNLLGLLETRTRALGDLRAASVAPRAAFRPEVLRGPAWMSRPIVNDLVWTPGLAVAVGSANRDRGSPGLIAFQSADEGAWTAWTGERHRERGAFQDAEVLGDTILVSGHLEGQAILLQVSQDRNVTPFFPPKPGHRAYGHLAVDRDRLAVELAAPEGQDARESRIHIHSPSDWARDFVVQGTVIDMVWTSTHLAILTETSTGMLVYFADATGETRLVPEGAVHSIPVDLFQRRQGLVATYIDQDNILRQESVTPGGTGPRDIFDGADMGDAVLLEPFAAHSLTEFIVDGPQNGTMRRVTFDRRGPQVEVISARPRVGRAQPYRPFLVSRDRLLLVPDRGAPRQAGEGGDRIFLYRSAVPELRGPAPTPELLSFLGGFRPEDGGAPLGGTATAASQGHESGASFMERSIAGATRLGREQWLATSEVWEAVQALERLDAEWRRLWEAREQAAVTLARLRAADQAGSLWNNISSLAARLSVILLLVYLVNILVNLYRYNMRLAAFYQARGDAITTFLASGLLPLQDFPQVIAELAEAHTPEAVTFGTRPQPPTETLGKTISDLAKLLRG